LNEVTERNDQLPPMHDAVVTLTLDNESKVDTIQGIGQDAVFTNIPHRYLGQQGRITFSAPDYLDVDTTVTIDKALTLNIRRDEAVYGHVSFGLWNPATENPIPYSTVEIAGLKATSDADGRVTLSVPLASQRKFYLVKASFPLKSDTIYMPCGEYDVLQKKIQ
jgi:hypothetical protein